MLVEKGNFDKDDQGWKLDEQFCSIGIENHTNFAKNFQHSPFSEFHFE